MLTAYITYLTTELTTIRSLSYCPERIDELVRTVSANDSRLANLKKRDQEVMNLQVTVTHVQNELNIQAQFIILRNEVEIIGRTENSNESLEHIV